MKTCGTYRKILSEAELFREKREIENLKELISQARLYDYGLRSLTGHLDRMKQEIEKMVKVSREGDLWFLRQALAQLYELEIFMSLEVPSDFKAIVVYFNFYNKAFRVIEENLRRTCKTSMTFKKDVKNIRDRFMKAIESVALGSGIYISNWRETDESATLYIQDVGITIVKLVYANRHSCNLAIIPKEVNTHKHKYTSEIHLSLEPTDGDQIKDGFRVRVTEPYAVPVKPGEWHGFEENRRKEPHKLIFLTGSPEILGWNVVNDRSVITTSKLQLKIISPDKIGSIGGIFLQREIEKLESVLSNAVIQRELIGYEATHGITLNLLGVPDTFNGVSNDVIFLVVKGKGQLKIEKSKASIREGDVFAVPFGMKYAFKREGLPLILLSSTLEEESMT
jgi:mannose-6-phosphate isomerase-like protein (cupin superfamily)